MLLFVCICLSVLYMDVQRCTYCNKANTSGSIEAGVQHYQSKMVKGTSSRRKYIIARIQPEQNSSGLLLKNCGYGVAGKKLFN